MQAKPFMRSFSLDGQNGSITAAKICHPDVIRFDLLAKTPAGVRQRSNPASDVRDLGVQNQPL